MKKKPLRRAACALAMGGWIMLVPPFSNQGSGVDYQAPLSQWDALITFPTFEKCNTLLQASQEPPPNLAAKATAVGAVEAMHHAFCVPADDPRLKD